ncbi:amino acid ABC transporter permease [Candidatus Clostridium stratigraminis]|uniref:Amino acid ABC transporter permease n=1 Tax=Candidatus Clostridium stratigraminis TaxID=3381661 RepID=A0ABW8T7J2_9CLOT
MDFSFLPKYYMFFLNGVRYTIVLAIFTVIFGVILGVILALMRISNNKLLNFIGAAYVEFIRGTPVLVQVYIIYYALPSLLGINLPDMAAGILALSINSGAYVAEIIRAGIQAVDKGQLEAARSLGMKYGTAMRYIIVPQAIKNILPALGNEFITVIKESSIVSVIGIHELMYNADTVRGNTFRAFEPLIIAAIMYFVLTYTLSKLMGIAERRLKTSD